MAKHRVALLEHFAPEVFAEIRAQLPDELELDAVSSADEQERLRVLDDADFALFAGQGTFTARHMDAAPKLKLIQKWGIGIDNIDLKAASERSIPVANTGGTSCVPVAEHTILLMLAVFRRLPYMDRKLREGVWLRREIRGVSYKIAGKTVGIVGLGGIGQEVAKRIKAFDARVIYYAKSGPKPELERQLGVEYRPLEELFAQSDIVSLHVPLTPETTNLVDAHMIARMKPHAILVNTSRGRVVDEPALLEALKSGAILGAGLDVFTIEPAEPGNPLFELDNVVVTPHTGGGVIDNVGNVARHAFLNMVKVANGETLTAADGLRSYTSSY